MAQCRDCEPLVYHTICIKGSFCTMNIPDVPAFAFRTLSMILQLLQYIQPYGIEGDVVELP
jgi:hypothetical protein